MQSTNRLVLESCQRRGSFHTASTHNGTFDLSMHPWFEPFERVLALGDERGIGIATPIMSERIGIDAPHAGERWWRSVVAVESAAR